MAVRSGQGGRLQRGKWTDDAMVFRGLSRAQGLKGTPWKTKADGELRSGPCLFLSSSFLFPPFSVEH